MVIRLSAAVLLTTIVGCDGSAMPGDALPEDSTQEIVPTDKPGEPEPEPQPGTGIPVSGILGDTTTIEGEVYTHHGGDRLDTAIDNDGNTYVGWIYDGYFTEYTINPSDAGRYRVTALVASKSNAARIRFSVDGQKVGSLTAESTGSWDSWVAYNGVVDLDSGDQNFRMTFEPMNGATDALLNIDRFVLSPLIDESAPPADAHLDIVKAIGVAGRDPQGLSWADSYSVAGRCYMDSSLGDGIVGAMVNTPDGAMSVRELSTRMQPGPGRAGNPIYNDIQCGNGPASPAQHETDCPGRVDIGIEGCGQIGPMWDLSDLLPAVSEPTTTVPANCTEVSSLAELSNYLDQSNNCVFVTPGTYTFDTSNVGTGKLFSDRILLLFSGSNNTFIFDGVTFEYDTRMFNVFGSQAIHNFHVVGDNNIFQNLTMEDLGNTVPGGTALGLQMDGTNNLVDGFTMTIRGSTPYGYGDIFGKGNTRVISHKKHSGVLIRGKRNHLRGLHLTMRSYGHGIYVQGGDNVLIEDVYVEGELSSVDAVLAERGTGSVADDVDFLTVWGYKLDELPENYRFSLQEDGIRAYENGEIWDSAEVATTGDITVNNCVVKFMRSGITLGWASGDVLVDGCTTLGVESGYWVGSNGTVVDSAGDASVGPLMSEDRYSSGSSYELTLLDNEVPKIGNTPSVYFGGTNNSLTLTDGTSYFHNDVELLISGDRFGHRWLEGSTETPLRINALRGTFDNRTRYPVTAGPGSSNVSISSCGPVSSGSNNNVSIQDC